MRIAQSPMAIGFAAALALSTAAIGQASGTPFAPSAGSAIIPAERAAEAELERVQYRGRYGAPRAGYGPRAGYYAPRYYAPPRAYYGGPAWGYRPWYHRPYYGTIIGGIALGTIIGVTAYGLAPRAPRPDLCWYWADDVQSRGYWDYC